MKEVTIVGGGLTGLSLGIALRRARVPVILHEAGQYPRHRVCGEFINGVGEETLARLGIADLFSGVLLHEETNWFLGRECIYEGRLERPALGISRKRLDLELATRFQELGGQLHTGSRQKEEVAEGHVWAAGRKLERNSRWLGLKVHVRKLTDRRGLEMHLGRHGYAGLAPIEGGRVNVCGLFRNHRYGGRGLELLWNCLVANGLGDLAGRLRGADPDADSFLGVSAFSFGLQSGAENLLTLGDAESMIPPFTGNGMSMAFEAAEIAVDPLRRYAGGTVCWMGALRDIRGSLRKRFRRRLFTARVLHPLLLTRSGRSLLAGAARSGALPFRTLSRILR